MPIQLDEQNGGQLVPRGNVPQNRGRVVSARGGVVEAQFEKCAPPINSLLRTGATNQIIDSSAVVANGTLQVNSSAGELIGALTIAGDGATAWSKPTILNSARRK